LRLPHRGSPDFSPRPGAPNGSLKETARIWRPSGGAGGDRQELPQLGEIDRLGQVEIGAGFAGAALVLLLAAAALPPAISAAELLGS
jgi:hypothetical protein